MNAFRLSTAALGSLILALAATGGCRHESGPSVSLLDRLDDAELERDAVGNSLLPGPGDPRWLDGWTDPDPVNPATGLSGGVWTMRGASGLAFYLNSPRPLRLLISAHPLVYWDAPVPRLGLSLNGMDLTPVALNEDWADTRVTLELPATAFRSGWNQLHFTHPWARRPVDVGIPPDTRKVAVWFSSLAFQEVDAPADPLRPADELRRSGLTLRGGDGVVRLTSGTAMRWSFSRSPRATLHLKVSGDNGARLKIQLFPDGGPPRELFAEAVEGRRSFQLDLTGDTVEPATLALVAEGKPLVLEEVRFSGTASLPGELTTPAVAVPHPALPAKAGAPPDTVLVFLVDALRADHLTPYGYPLPTSPRLAKFAATAERFDDAWATVSWTKPAVASLLTGLPSQENGTGGLLTPLAADVPYLPEQFRKAGYRTIGASASPNVSGLLGFARGFDRFDFLPAHGPKPEGAAAVLDRFAAALHDTPAKKPLFAYVHIVEPHTPYLPSPSHSQFLKPGLVVPDHLDVSPYGLPDVTPDFLESRRGRYDGEVLEADEAFARALELLSAAGRLERALIVFVADHGEEFGEHDGLEHGETLYVEVNRIPLLIRWPDGRAAGAVNRSPVSQLDLAPTLQAAAGLPRTPGAGEPLQSAPQEPRLRYSSLMDGGVAESLRAGPWDYHLIHRRDHFPGKAAEQLYNLAADPAERHNLATDFPARATLMRAALRRLAPRLRAPATPVQDPELIRQLKALGYLH